MEAVEKQVIELKADLRNMKERVKDDQERTDKRLCNVEKDITEIKVVLERTDSNVANIATVANETQVDVKKAKGWLIATMILFFLGLVSTALINLLS